MNACRDELEGQGDVGFVGCADDCCEGTVLGRKKRVDGGVMRSVEVGGC